MKYSYKWIKELTSTKLSAEKMLENLTMHSFEVEGIEYLGKELDGVIIGKILEITKHPNADKLQLVRVDVGKGSTQTGVLDIVCGAKNIQVGDKVPVALVGTKLPNGLEIREAEIRGQRSFGMLCAPDEIGLGQDHSGIMILNPKAKPGMALAQYLGLDDVVFEIKVLPDRAHDAMSHVGVAREVATLERKKFEYDFDGLKLPRKKSKKLTIEVKDKVRCTRYIGAMMENVAIQPSPEWMRQRLAASGMNAINNIVDATNYVMLELGQPLHAFDADKLEAHRIVVRRANKEEKINLLDKGEKTLTPEDLLITDGKRPAALAGIKGARIAEIDATTKNIVLEAASFNAAALRKSRTRLGLKTDSSDRFEKEIDPNLAEKAMVRVIEIIEHIAGGQLEGVVDVYPKKNTPVKIRLDLNYVNALLGEIVPTKETITILQLLGMQVKKGKTLEVLVPTYRVDLKTQEDLIEDIGRIWGYEKVKPRPIREASVAARTNVQLAFERRIKMLLANSGFDEVYNYSVYSQQEIDKVNLDPTDHLELHNPMNPDQQFIRLSLVPQMLRNIQSNIKNFKELSLFEVGRCYQKIDQVIKEDRLVSIARVLDKDAQADTFYTLKGSVEDFFEQLGISDYQFQSVEDEASFAHPTRTAQISCGDIILGFMGEVSPIVSAKYKLGKRVAIAELDLVALNECVPKDKTYRSISKYPVITRDISLLAQKSILVSAITEVIKNKGGQLVWGIELFDIYQKEIQNSFAFHIAFGSCEKTLESNEVDRVMAGIVSGLEKELGVEIRK